MKSKTEHSSRGQPIWTVLAVALIVTLMASAVFIVSHARSTVGIRPTFTPHATSLPNASYIALAGNDAVGPDLAAFYQSHSGATFLGGAITPELPSDQGLVQIYQSGVAQQTIVSTAALQPIVSQLIQAGAIVQLVSGGNLTYASLAPLTGSMQMVSAPPQWHAGADPTTAGIFVPLGTQGANQVGHYIPPDFAAFLTQAGAWQSMLGNPLTEATGESVTGNNAVAYATLLPFERGVLIEATSGGGRKSVQIGPAGYDWLSIFGAPRVSAIANTSAHETTKATIFLSAGGSTPMATFQTSFAIVMLGPNRWIGNSLWYNIGWQNLLEKRTGWVKADGIAFGAFHEHGPEIAGVAALSSSLQAYVDTLGNNVAMAVYVPSENRYYELNANLSFETASVIKVPILVTLLHEAEQQGRSLSSEELTEAQAMIEQSDNDAADALYLEEGGPPPIDAYLKSLGINGLWVNPQDFGYSTMPPVPMLQLMEDLRLHKILTPSDCDYVLNLMENVVSFERMGLGDTAPTGATVAMKDGFGQVEDGSSVVVTVGFLTYQGQTYDVSVFTRNETSVDQGTVYINTICRDTALALLGQQ